MVYFTLNETANFIFLIIKSPEWFQICGNDKNDVLKMYRERIRYKRFCTTVAMLNRLHKIRKTSYGW